MEVAEGGQLSSVHPAAAPAAPVASGSGEAVNAVLAGNIFKVNVAVGEVVNAGDPLLVVEAIKMETAVAAPKAGTVTKVAVSEGDVVAVGDPLISVA